MRYFIWIICILIFCQFPLQAQSRAVQKAYNTAKQWFSKENYELAMPYFKTVMDSDENNKLVENAYFFYALSAQKRNDLLLAEFTYQNMLSKYPEWKQKDEIYYALADLAFQRKENEQAINYLNQIKSPSLREDMLRMKGYYALQMDILPLRLLQQTFPKDTALAQFLTDKIAATSNSFDDIDFMESLISKYQLQKPEKRKLGRRIFTKTPFKVAVILPFEIRKLKNKDTTNFSRLSMNFYQGMRLAENELDTLEGAKVKLFAYDINREQSDTLEKMINLQEFEDMDLIVGPIFEDSFKKMADFALKKNINLINPLSFDTRLLMNKFTYLYESAPETQALKTAEFAYRNSTSKTVVILYDNLTKNRVFAEIYKRKADSLGLKVLVFEQVNTFDLIQLSQLFSKFNKGDIGSIFISSTSQLIAEEMIKKLKELDFGMPVFTPDAWLKFQSIAYEDYELLNVHFIYPDYLDLNTPEAIKFKKLYYDLARNEPNNYAFEGYEIVRYFADILAAQGTKVDFRMQNSKPTKGKYTDAFDYKQGNDNQFVPILKIVEGEPVIANPIK